MRGVALACCLALFGGTVPALAASCPGNPHALGTSRVLSISPTEFARIGSMQYSQVPQIPLNDHEVVLTFDDGPLPPYTATILNALAAECVKATYFLVGRQANAFPDLVRRIYNAGHVIGTHSQNHPLTFDQMPLERAEREINDGIASVGAALGDPRAVAPFFRIPGLLRVDQVENYLGSRAIATWSTDFVADDWYRSVSARDIVRKAMTRLDSKGRGILLLHDIHPATAMAIPMLLRELKARGYRVVQVVPNAERPRAVADRGAASKPDAQAWPRIVQNEASPLGTQVRAKPQRHRRKITRIDREPSTTASIRRKKAQTANRGW